MADRSDTARILVTGGAGFVGANVSIALAARFGEHQIIAFDNLSRRGSELNLPRLREANVTFVHGDVRELSDVMAIAPVDAIVECSAEPSVMAGLNASPDYVFKTNLVGAYHCLELARRDVAQFIFLSTSRVYPIHHLSRIALQEGRMRFEISDQQSIAGVSPAGINEHFPLEGARTLYGATKLSAEHMVAEYQSSYGVRAVVNRCGVLAGPWQMGKVDQGVFTFWMLSHVFRRPLTYIGYGGKGKQVRDLLHVDDLVALISEQLGDPDAWSGCTVNVGGGPEISLSLKEATALCSEISGNRVEIGSSPNARPGDVPVYVSDCARLFAMTNWRPQRDARTILTDIYEWVCDNQGALEHAL